MAIEVDVAEPPGNGVAGVDLEYTVVGNAFISSLDASTAISGLCDGVERERSERDARRSVALTENGHILLTDSIKHSLNWKSSVSNGVGRRFTTGRTRPIYNR